MGYYANYELSVHKKNSDVVITQELRDRLEQELDDTYFFESGNFDDGWYAYTSWRSDIDDMVEFSRRFPELLFEMRIAGETPTDLSICYFCNGKYQICYASIVFDDPDLVALTA